MKFRATGSFAVKLLPQPTHDAAPTILSRMSIDKQYSGDLEATSNGEMLAGGTATKGSAGYVAIEQVSGTLQGRSGTFCFQHFGIMSRGKPHLIVSVIPDSGTEGLTGLTGDFSIEITEGKHFYTFNYDFVESKS